MDVLSIGLSAVLSAVLFVILEFTVILPLFRKIVTKSVNDTVNNQLIPSITAFVDSKVDDLTARLTKSLFVKFRGFLGGSKKGVNSILNRLADGEDLEDLEDDYEPSTIDKVINILDTASQYLPSMQRGVNNGSKETQGSPQDTHSVQDSTPQTWKEIERA